MRKSRNLWTSKISAKSERARKRARGKKKGERTYNTALVYAERAMGG